MNLMAKGKMAPYFAAGKLKLSIGIVRLCFDVIYANNVFLVLIFAQKEKAVYPVEERGIAKR
jgi:hypothetical protein